METEHKEQPIATVQPPSSVETTTLCTKIMFTTF